MWDGKYKQISEARSAAMCNVFWFLRIRSLLRVLLIRMRAKATRQHQRKTADTINSLLFSTLCFALLLCRIFLFFFIIYENFLSLSMIFGCKIFFFFTTMSLSEKERDSLTFVISFWHHIYVHVRSFILVSARWMDEKCRRGREMERITGGWRQKMQRLRFVLSQWYLIWEEIYYSFFPLCKSMWVRERERNSSLFDHSAHFFFIIRCCYFAHS